MPSKMSIESSPTSTTGITQCRSCSNDFFGPLLATLSAADVACVISLEEVVRDCYVVACRLAAAAVLSLAALAVLVEAEEGGEPPNQHKTDRPEDHRRDVVAGAVVEVERRGHSQMMSALGGEGDWSKR